MFTIVSIYYFLIALFVLLYKEKIHFWREVINNMLHEICLQFYLFIVYGDDSMLS